MKRCPVVNLFFIFHFEFLILNSQTGVIRDFVSDEQGERRLGQFVKRSGPRMQVNAMLFLQFAQAVVKDADAQIPIRVVQAAETAKGHCG